jgi:hypothetical protein
MIARRYFGRNWIVICFVFLGFCIASRPASPQMMGRGAGAPGLSAAETVSRAAATADQSLDGCGGTGKTPRRYHGSWNGLISTRNDHAERS